MKKLYVLMLVAFIGLQAGNETSQVHPKNSIEKVKAFLGTKEGKLTVGAVGLGATAGVICLIYYFLPKNNKGNQQETVGDTATKQDETEITKEVTSDTSQSDKGQKQPKSESGNGPKQAKVDETIDDEAEKEAIRTMEAKRKEFAPKIKTREQLRNEELTKELAERLYPKMTGSLDISVQVLGDTMVMRVESENMDFGNDLETFGENKRFFEPWVQSKARSGINSGILEMYHMGEKVPRFSYTFKNERVDQKPMPQPQKNYASYTAPTTSVEPHAQAVPEIGFTGRVLPEWSYSYLSPIDDPSLSGHCEVFSRTGNGKRDLRICFFDIGRLRDGSAQIISFEKFAKEYVTPIREFVRSDEEWLKIENKGNVTLEYYKANLGERYDKVTSEEPLYKIILNK